MSDSGHNKLFSFPLYSYNWLKCSVQQPTTLYFCGEHLQMLPTFYQFTKKGVILNAYIHHQIYILYHIIWWRFTNMLICVSEYRVYMRFTVPRAWNVTPTFGVYTWTKHTPAMPINSSCAGFCASMKQQQIEKYFNILIGNVIHPNIYTSALFFFVLCLVSVRLHPSCVVFFLFCLVSWMSFRKSQLDYSMSVRLDRRRVYVHINSM